MRITLFLSIAVAACATTPPPEPGGPRGLRASEHLAAARTHDEAARERMSWPTREAGPAADTRVNLWFRTWDTAADHERLAAEHRSEAAALQAAYDEACGERHVEHVAISPLVRYRMGGWNTSTGAVVYLHPDAGSADELLASLKCHRAWMMLAPSPAMDSCPLDLPGLILDARGDGQTTTLVITVKEPKLVPELQRRIAKQLEAVPRERHEQ
jgi:hypothetical protein